MVDTRILNDFPTSRRDVELANSFGMDSESSRLLVASLYPNGAISLSLMEGNEDKVKQVRIDLSADEFTALVTAAG